MDQSINIIVFQRSSLVIDYIVKKYNIPEKILDLPLYMINKNTIISGIDLNVFCPQKTVIADCYKLNTLKKLGSNIIAIVDGLKLDFSSDISVHDINTVKIYTGTSGFTAPFYWWKDFYREHSKKELEYYSTLVNSVEINCTRYRKLTIKQTSQWFAKTPENFKFTVKIPEYITHAKKLNGFDEWWVDFFELVKPLKHKLVAFLFLFPQIIHCTEKNIKTLEHIKTILPVEYDYAFEFRNIQWYDNYGTDSGFRRRLRELFSDNWGLATIHVTNGAKSDLGDDSTVHIGNIPNGWHNTLNYRSRFMYIRFHGTVGVFQGHYDDNTLDSTIRDYTELAQKYGIKKIYMYFNNTDSFVRIYVPEKNYVYELPAAIRDSIYIHSKSSESSPNMIRLYDNYKNYHTLMKLVNVSTSAKKMVGTIDMKKFYILTLEYQTKKILYDIKNKLKICCDKNGKNLECKKFIGELESKCKKLLDKKYEKVLDRFNTLL